MPTLRRDAALVCTGAAFRFASSAPRAGSGAAGSRRTIRDGWARYASPSNNRFQALVRTWFGFLPQTALKSLKRHARRAVYAGCRALASGQRKRPPCGSLSLLRGTRNLSALNSVRFAEALVLLAVDFGRRLGFAFPRQRGEQVARTQLGVFVHMLALVRVLELNIQSQRIPPWCGTCVQQRLQRVLLAFLKRPRQGRCRPVWGGMQAQHLKM